MFLKICSRKFLCLTVYILQIIEKTNYLLLEKEIVRGTRLSKTLSLCIAILFYERILNLTINNNLPNQNK